MSRLYTLLDWDARVSARIVCIAALERIPWRRIAARVLAHTGDSWLVLLVGGLLWVRDFPQLGFRLILSVLVTATVSSLLKALIRRTRPKSQNDTLYLGPDRYSFPSGHATRLGGVLAVTARVLPLWGITLLVLWAIAVCLSRIALRAHYLGDIAAGLGLGLVAGVALLVLM